MAMPPAIYKVFRTSSHLRRDARHQSGSLSRGVPKQRQGRVGAGLAKSFVPLE